MNHVRKGSSGDHDWDERAVANAGHVVSVSTDVPFLTADLLARLEAALEQPSCRITLARSAGQLHPVIGLWPVDLADDREAALRSGMRKVLDWTGRHSAKGVDFPLVAIQDRLIDPFFNANTREELAKARGMLSR